MDISATPFHEGELAVQDKLGVREQVHSYAPKFVRSYLPDQHQQLLATLPFIVIGSVDENKQPSASMVFGQPGFICATDEKTVSIASAITEGDPLGDNLCQKAPLGLLAIDFETRRRNRLSAKVIDVDAGNFSIRVDQSFGNCPQYIQSRTLPKPKPHRNGTGKTMVENNIADVQLAARLDRADTFFIASSHFENAQDEKHGVDVSHRGGRPGFIRYEKGTLTFPDFTGNNHYNTIGNIMMNPQVGIVVPDFGTGALLYVHGNAEIIWDGTEVEQFDGALRLVKIRIHHTRLVHGAMPSNWHLNDYSPSLDATGTWTDPKDAGTANSWRKLRVDRIDRESSVINSYYLSPVDGRSIEPYIAGQHLPIRRIDDKKTTRTYTISIGPDANQYRLSIKRETNGAMSRFFHDELRVGDKLEALAPRGNFHLNDVQGGPQILLSAGVGITPMIAMLEDLIKRRGQSDTQPSQPILFIHAARDGDEHAYENHPILQNPERFGVSVFYAYSSPTTHDVVEKTFHHRGRLNKQVLSKLLPDPRSEVFLCGPSGFMDTMRSAFITLGVAEENIRQETFGANSNENSSQAPDIDIPVELKASGTQLEWNPSKNSLLESIEEKGADAPFSCRVGNCGTCLTKILKGNVTHPELTRFPFADDEALLCCAAPTDDTARDGLVLDL